MSDVNKIRSGAGVQYGFEDTVAREKAEQAISIANKVKAMIRPLSIENDTLVITTFVFEEAEEAPQGETGTPQPLPEGDDNA